MTPSASSECCAKIIPCRPRNTTIRRFYDWRSDGVSLGQNPALSFSEIGIRVFPRISVVSGIVASRLRSYHDTHLDPHFLPRCLDGALLPGLRRRFVRRRDEEDF